jgi:hypothetical protein
MNPELFDILRQLRPTGPDGFEGLIASLLEALTGSHFALATSGSQGGRDMSSRRPSANVVAVECKRYGESTELNERELLGELVQAGQSIPDLDLWVLVTSRDVPSQLREALNRPAAEKGIGFLSISSGDGVPSSLEVLCANSPETVCTHAGVQAVAGAVLLRTLLQQVAEHPKYQERLSQLRDTFSSPLAGYENWRVQHNRWFIDTLKSDQESWASHGQPINVEDPAVMLIRREAAWQSLDEWQQGWNDTRNYLAILGEEGDGKTWSVASWLSERIKHTPENSGVVFLSSTDVPLAENGSTELISIFSSSISRQLPSISREQVQMRLSRWLSRPVGHLPILLLILDGINERGRPDQWRGILEQLSGESWRNHVAVLITCRTSYWERYFSKLRHLPVSSFVIGPYDEIELATALSYHNLNREDIDDNVLPLIRKPRYFDLMVRHHARISESGDVTVARLIYEDWRDRYGRKRAVKLTDDDFQNVIRHLAQAHNGTYTQLSGQEVADALPVLYDKQSTLEELQTGGILQPSRGKYKVDDRLLVYGLGLLLVDQLEEAYANGQDLRETIAGWLEPHAEMDIKAAICEFAALHALSLDNLQLDATVALLEAWINSRNPTENIESNLTAYLPLNPQAYVALAESVWSDSYDNRWAQELLTRSFLRWFESPRIAHVLRAAFERWLGFVHIQGSPFLRDNAEEAEKATREIFERLGRSIELGPLEFARYSLTVINDDGLLRLGRVALAIISHLPRNQFISALAVGCLAEVIMGRPDKYELFAWIVRTSPQNIWPDLRREVNQLLEADNALTRRVARRLLSFEGSEEAHSLRETIPNETLPSDPLIERHRQDPCTSGFTWSEVECVTCLQREDVPVHWVARQLERRCVNPALPVPAFRKAQFSSLTEGIDTQNLWVVLGPTAADHELKTYEPALAAYAPESLAALIRSTARQITERKGIERRQLSIGLVKHYLILHEEEQEAVHSAWDELVSNADEWDENDEDAEMFIFKVVLAHLDEDAQLAALLRRPDVSLDLVNYKYEFLPIKEWGFVRSQLRSVTDTKALTRTLWFLTVNPEGIPNDLLNTLIVPLLSHEHAFVRSLVLELVYRTKDANAINSVIGSGWHWEPLDDGFQNHWGSLILCEHGERLSFDDLCRRMPPSYIGYAVMHRGYNQNEVQAYAEFIHQLWLQIGANSPELPPDLTPFNVESSASGDIQRVNRRKLAHDDSTYSITFLDPNSTWGGMEESGDLNVENWNANAAVDQHRKLWEIIGETIEQQKAAGNSWFGQSFHEETLDKIIEEHPDLIGEWISPTVSNSTIRRGSSFYSALCAVLLREQADKGIELYSRLQETDRRIQIIDHDTQLDLLDYALFDTTPNEVVKNAWRRELERCDTDQELMKVTLLAQNGTGGEWLRSYINERLHSSVPLDKARGIVLSGLLDDQRSLELIQQLAQSQTDTWPGEIAKTAVQRQFRNVWAKYWFTRFLTADDDTVAWASYRLFLRCVDSRFWFWREKVEADAGGTGIDPKREVFFNCNQEDLRNAIKSNEKDMSEQFLGQKIKKRQVWPWL